MTTYDYTNSKRRWWHDLSYSIIDAWGLRLKASGWGICISEGDYILLSNGSDETRYQFESIDYYANPMICGQLRYSLHHGNRSNNNDNRRTS